MTALAAVILVRRAEKHARAKGLKKIGGVIWFALDTRHRAAL
jgi:hypothetical protein